MTDKKFNFTDERLRKLTADNGKRTLFYDSNKNGPGLAIMVTPAGAKSFKFRSWDSIRGKSGTLTIGTYPKVNLTTAREQAAKWALDLTNGIDIWGQAQAERDIPTLDQAFARWVTKKAAKGKTSWPLDKLRYNKHIQPRFGNKRVNDITSRQVEDWFLSFPKKTGLSATSANRLLVIIKTVYNQELRQYPNPCNGISLNREESRERFLRPAELPAFFDALNDERTPDHLRDFVYLALYTGGRKANLLGMRWADIDFDLCLWTIPAARSKNRTIMTIPLIPAALDILIGRQRINHDSKTPSFFVFPAINAQGKTGHMNDIRDSWEALLKRAGVADFRIHDLRRTVGSWQTICGSNAATVGKSLGHKSQQATAIYSRLHLDPIRESVQKAVDAMQSTRTAPSTVTQMNGGKK